MGGRPGTLTQLSTVLAVYVGPGFPRCPHALNHVLVYEGSPLRGVHYGGGLQCGMAEGGTDYDLGRVGPPCETSQHVWGTMTMRP